MLKFRAGFRHDPQRVNPARFFYEVYMAKVQTVKIKVGKGFAVINAVDFDPEKMQKADDAKPAKKARAKKATKKAD